MTLDSLKWSSEWEKSPNTSQWLWLSQKTSISAMVHWLISPQEDTQLASAKAVRSSIWVRFWSPVDWFEDNFEKKFLSYWKLKPLVNFLMGHQWWKLTQSQSRYLLDYCWGVKINTTWIKAVIQDSIAIAEALEPYSPYVFVAGIQKWSKEPEEIVWAISLEQIKWENGIVYGWKGYHSITYYKSLYPNLNTRFLKRFFENSMRKLAIIDEAGTSLGYVYLIPDNLISSDNSDLYFDIIQRNIKKKRYYTLKGFNSIYGHEYDIRKIISFSYPKSLIIDLTIVGSLYSKEEIDRVIASRRWLIEINSIESAWVDLCDKPKALIDGKLYLRAYWKGFTDNPYFIAFVNNRVSDFATVRKVHIKEKLAPLEKRKWELSFQISILNKDVNDIRIRIEDITRSVQSKWLSSNDSNRIDELKILLKNKSIELNILNTEYWAVTDEILKYKRGIMPIDEPWFIVIDWELFVEEQMLIDAMKDFKDPLIENPFWNDIYSGSRIHNWTIYIQDPRKIFVWVQIEWNKFLKKIPQQRIAEWDTPSYLYETVVNELQRGWFVYKDSVNRGIIALHQRYWINIDSDVALDDLAAQIHRWIGGIKSTLKEMRQHTSLWDLGRIQLFNLDTWNMQILYDKNEFSKLLLSNMSTHY